LGKYETCHPRESAHKREVEFLLSAIQACAVHPKFLDDGVVAEASVAEDYLNFAGQLHWFASDIEEVFAAKGTLSANFVEEKWQEFMPSVRCDEEPFRVALAYFRRLVEELREQP
jgi:hypothetical protein